LKHYNSFHEKAGNRIENYKIELSGVAVLELVIVPDNKWGDAKASPMRFCLA
jgi:hypothetical protein